MKFRNLVTRGALLGAALFGSVVAHATPAGDYDAIVAAVDWAEVITGIAAIAALIAAVLIVRKGARMLLSFLK